MLEAGRIDEAIEHFNKVLRINNNNSNAYVNLGMAYSRLGKYEQAIQNWTTCNRAKAQQHDVLNNMAWLLTTRDEVSAEDANKGIEFAEKCL